MSKSKTFKKTKLLTGLTVVEQLYKENEDYYYLIDIKNGRKLLFFSEKHLCQKEVENILKKTGL